MVLYFNDDSYSVTIKQLMEISRNEKQDNYIVFNLFLNKFSIFYHYYHRVDDAKGFFIYTKVSWDKGTAIYIKTGENSLNENSSYYNIPRY